MKQSILFTLLLLAAFVSRAANLVIEVKDKSNNESLPLAKLEYLINNENKNATTNAYGKCEFKDIHFPIKIVCNYMGFQPFEKEITETDCSKKNEKYVFVIFLHSKVNDMNGVVITAQATPVLASQSIYKVNTISNTQIQQRGANALNEVMNFEMNNFVSNDNVLGSNVSIGGIGGQNVKILINGIPLMGRENGNIDLGQINLPNIKRIETIQGPMSVIYGSNALGGVINLITQTPLKPYSVSLKNYNESIGRYNVSSTFSYTKKKSTLQFSFTRNYFKGWNTPDSMLRFKVWKPKTQYMADFQYNYQFNKKIKLTNYTSFLQEKITNKGVPIINPFEGYAFDEYYRTYRFIQSVGINIKPNEKDEFSFVNSYTNYVRVKNRFKKDLVTLKQFETKNVGDQDTSQTNAFNARGTYSTSRIKNVALLMGYEYTFEHLKSFRIAEEKKQIGELGIFISSAYTHKKWSLQPSARYIYNSQYNSSWSPAIHGKYDVSKNTQLRMSFAQGFRTPTLKELYLQFVDQNHTIIGNPALKPEIGQHFEMGITHAKNTNKHSLQASATIYYNNIKNLISLAVYNGHGVLRQYANLQQYQNAMFNTQLKWNYKNMSWQQGIGCSYVFKSSVIPQHTIYEVSSSISYTVKPIKTTINFNYKFNSKQPVLTIDNQYLFTNPIHVGNVSVQKSFFKNYLQTQIGIKNLFNIKTANLNGATDLQGNPHSSSTGMQLFPARSFFINLNYSL